jgi:hypothetical protein
LYFLGSFTALYGRQAETEFHRKGKTGESRRRKAAKLTSWDKTRDHAGWAAEGSGNGGHIWGDRHFLPKFILLRKAKPAKAGDAKLRD